MPKGKTKKVYATFYVDHDLLKKAKRVAKAKGQKYREVVEWGLREYLLRADQEK